MNHNVIVFDLDGVVREFRSDAADDIIEARLDLPKGAVAEAAFDGPELVEAITGRINFEQWADSIVDRLSRKHPDAEKVRSEFARWIEYRGDLVPETISLLDELNENGYAVFAFTNGTSLIEQEIRGHGLEHRFRGVVNSADLGYRKPEPEALEAAHRTVEEHLARSVQRDEVLFVDDRMENIEAARKFGWEGIHFVSIADLATIRSAVVGG